MMGRVERQEQLFYRLRLEDCIPEDHLLRRVDQFVDFSALAPNSPPFTAIQAAPRLTPS